MLGSVKDWHADKKAFSVRGRIATISYAPTRARKRLSIEGSATETVQRRRMVVLEGSLREAGTGMGFITGKGTGQDM